MIRVRQISIPIDEDNLDRIKDEVGRVLKIKKDEIKEVKIKKKSIDARKKEVVYSYIVDLEVVNEKQVLKKNKSNNISVTPDEEYKFEASGSEKLKHRPVVVGSGPCGLFCAYFLAIYNYKPIIIERGDKVEDRVKKVEEFFETGKLDINSNVQFGEGGAGTFSDGKLNTLVKDKEFRQKKIFEIFVENGAPEEILYEAKPHIGTDVLRKVVKNMRKKIISMGGEFHFNTTLTSINYQDNKLVSIEVNNKDIIDTEVLVLSIGHSARDTFKMLYDKKLDMTSKPFAVGLRIMHPQKLIDENQYGKEYKKLPPSTYKLTYQASNNRGVYTFCMCPGGYVVNASSEEEMLAVNGMSNYKRESKVANSAVIVTVNPSDFGDHPLDGINYQRNLEKLAYKIGNGKIPIQYYQDFKERKVVERDVYPTFMGSYKFSDLNEIFDEEIRKALIEGIDNFNGKIKDFSGEDALLAGVESRTSSPVRIVRDEEFNSSVLGIYPAGEGAGYAGGITSASIDGVKVFEKIASKYKA